MGLVYFSSAVAAGCVFLLTYHRYHYQTSFRHSPIQIQAFWPGKGKSAVDTKLSIISNAYCPAYSF
jgi:hypothetical protein